MFLIFKLSSSHYPLIYSTLFYGTEVNTPDLSLFISKKYWKRYQFQLIYSNIYLIDKANKKVNNESDLLFSYE